jgi:hypothetical protein
VLEVRLVQLLLDLLAQTLLLVTAGGVRGIIVTCSGWLVVPVVDAL